MQTVFTCFSTQEDRVRGFYELAVGAHASSFPGCIRLSAFGKLRFALDRPATQATAALRKVASLS